MMISPTSSYSSSGLSASAVGNSSTTGKARVAKQQLGQDDFLQLLATQLKQQDPMKPMDDTAFIAQMAQFSSLQSMNQMRADQQQLMAASYIGKSVTVQDPGGKPVTGLVTAVDNSGDQPTLVINNTSYKLSTVKRIEPNATLANPTPTAVTTPAA